MVSHIVAVGLLLHAWGARQRLSRRALAVRGALGLILIAAPLVAMGWFLTTKWLGRLAMPLSVLWLLLGVGAGWLASGPDGWRGRAPQLVLAAFVLEWVVACPWVGAQALRALEAPFRRPLEQVPELPAIMVLGGGTSARPGGGVQGTTSADRLLTAARLYHLGRTSRLLCSGTAVAVGGTMANLGGQAKVLLEGLGVPGSAIEIVPGPRNTREELAALAALASERGWAEVGVVSSAWHLRRVLRHAAREGVTVIAVGADFRGGDLGLNPLSLLPSADGVMLLRLAAWEWLGAAVGR